VHRVVVGLRLGVGGAESGPVGREPARFDEDDLDPEGGDFLGEGFARAFQGPLRGARVGNAATPPPMVEICTMCPWP
jgi:hypothetical protein